MVTDQLADLIIQIKNAGMAKKTFVEIPYSKIKYYIAQKLRTNNFVADVEEKGSGIKKRIVLHLLYDKSGKHKVKDVKRISKPGRRIYLGTRDVRPIKYGNGLLILSTSKGVLTGNEAKKERVGGEALFSIW